VEHLYNEAASVAPERFEKRIFQELGRGLRGRTRFGRNGSAEEVAKDSPLRAQGIVARKNRPHAYDNNKAV